MPYSWLKINEAILFTCAIHKLSYQQKNRPESWGAQSKNMCAYYFSEYNFISWIAVMKVECDEQWDKNFPW
jgi:hypothetical protein